MPTDDVYKSLMECGSDWTNLLHIMTNTGIRDREDLVGVIGGYSN